MLGNSPWSSAQYSVNAYMPMYAPPVTPQSNYIQGSSPVLTTIDQQGGEQWDQHSKLVNRDPRRIGIRTLFSYGGQLKPWFKMIRTGGVESSKFQPRTNHTWDGEFNDALYQAGYPRNLGLTFKVGTVNRGINPPWTQMPAPNARGRTIYTARRPVTSGIPGVPAIPTRSWN